MDRRIGWPVSLITSLLAQLGLTRVRAQRHYSRALQFYLKGQPELAAADLTEAIKYNPRNPELYCARGVFYASTGYHKLAEEDFERALSRSPGQWLAIYGQGMLAFYEKDFESAVERFSRAAELAPKRPEIYYFRAVAYYKNGKREQALADMDKARELMPQDDPRQNDAALWQRVFEKVKRRRSKRKKVS